jgi:hypothetical protein
MKASSIVPALTVEARLKRRLREHLSNLGFSRNNEGLLAPPGDDKAAIRALHEGQRRDRLQTHKAFLKANLSELSTHFANGSDIDPQSISLRLQKIEAGTFESALFRLATLTWSVPVSNGFGRRLRYLVWDEHNNKLAGLFAIGEPVVTNSCAFYTSHARLRVQRAPGVSCALCFRGKGHAQLGRSAPRDGGRLTRHCEERKRRSNPFFLYAAKWIASLALAMTAGLFRHWSIRHFGCLYTPDE